MIPYDFFDSQINSYAFLSVVGAEQERDRERERERERGRYREIEIDNGGVECTMKRNINFQAHINLSYKLLLKQSFFSSAHGAGFPMINNSCDNKVLV